jgi:hypothetical protein
LLSTPEQIAAINQSFDRQRSNTVRGQAPIGAVTPV